MAQANSAGAISIVLGLDPTMISNAPSGAFQVANLTFNSNTPNLNAAAVISFNTGQMQLVATDQSVFQLTSTNLNLVLNPTTPTPTPTATPTTTPTATPTATPTPTSTSNLTPTPTATSTSTATPTGSNKVGDVNGDGVVNILDIGEIINNYGATGSPGWIRSDLNGDGVINILDIGIVVNNYYK